MYLPTVALASIFAALVGTAYAGPHTKCTTGSQNSYWFNAGQSCCILWGQSINSNPYSPSISYTYSILKNNCDEQVKVPKSWPDNYDSRPYAGCVKNTISASFNPDCPN